MFPLTAKKIPTFSVSALPMSHKAACKALGLAASLAALMSGTACMAQSTDDEWYNAATAANRSTVTEASALSWNFTAPDGRTVVARVRQPAVTNNVSVTLPAIPNGADARPYFEKLVADAIKAGANRIIIPAGTYVFKTVNPTSAAHWPIQSLVDVVIQANGAKLIFQNNAGGIYINNCQRLRIAGLSIDYALHTTSFARMIDVNGTPVLQIDADTPVTAADGLGHITEFDKTTMAPNPTDLRVYMPSASNYTYIGNQRYTSPLFSKNYVGKTFLVYHHYYGGSAMKIYGDPIAGAKQTEDITLEGVAIRKVPGMGIVVSGVKRGVAIVNSQIAPPAGQVTSTEYDAIHVLLPGGDLGITGNLISGAGDDNINVDSSVDTVSAVDTAAKKIQLNDYMAYFVAAGQTLAAFDGNFKYLGTATVTAKPTVVNGIYTVQLDRNIPGLAAGMLIRNVARVTNRVAINKNSFVNGGSVLVQVGNAWVANNSFKGSDLRLLSNFAQFKEGMGAMNVLVENNQFEGGKRVNRWNFPYGAISAYGLNSSSVISTTQVNRYLTIRNNTITNVPNSCISVASAYKVQVTGNSCKNVNTTWPGAYDLNLTNVNDVTMSANSVSTALPLRLVSASLVR